MVKDDIYLSSDAQGLKRPPALTYIRTRVEYNNHSIEELKPDGLTWTKPTSVLWTERPSADYNTSIPRKSPLSAKTPFQL